MRLIVIRRVQVLVCIDANIIAPRGRKRENKKAIRSALATGLGNKRTRVKSESEKKAALFTLVTAIRFAFRERERKK